MKPIKYILLSLSTILLTNLTFSNNPTLPEPYKSINVLAPDYFEWWFPLANRKMLQHFITTMKPTVVVEIGSWLGASAIFMAGLLPDESKLYAIDHWQGSREHFDGNYNRLLVKLYHQFLSNVIHSNVAHKIVPVKTSSLDAATLLDINPDLIYIDGSHDPVDVYNDIMAWYPKLAVGGIMCGDDYGWGNEQVGYVNSGVDKAAAELGVSVSVIDDVFWYFPPKV
ncbi:MAG: class I SAM-dependent methyltransferase [Candidatus Dependentiae bacterium]|nr:class I SAM-dependent methyltransferase [Candidatus Dependentiae bacterium]